MTLLCVPGKTATQELTHFLRVGSRRIPMSSVSSPRSTSSLDLTPEIKTSS